MTFHSNENKGLLWNLLSEQGLFKGINESRLPEVRSSFENNITQINENGGDLMTLNKKFVQKMLNDLQMFKGLAPPQSGKRKGNAIQEVYTAEKIQNNRVEKFNSQLTSVKSEFDSMIKLKKPNEIDFSDNKQEFSTNIDNDLAAAISSRQLDMEQMVTSQQTTKQEAESWINSESKSSNPIPPQNVIVDVKEKLISKQVTFDDSVKNNDNNLDDLFGNLKQQTASLRNKVEPDDGGVASLLKEMVFNQKIMIELLTKIHSQNSLPENSKEN